MKIAAGCINGYTPTHGLVLNSGEYAVPSPSVIYSVQASFSQPPSMMHIPSTPKPLHVGMVELPPPPNATPLGIPAFNLNNAGMVFMQLVSRRNPNVSVDYNSTLGNASGAISVINGHPING